MSTKNTYETERGIRGFTRLDLLVVVVLLGCLASIAFASTQQQSLARCVNNFRQLSSAWAMYTADNNGSLVSSYPSYAGFMGSWVYGTASSDGGAGSYSYGGADPRGITSGLLWPYVKSFTPYKCPADERVAPGAPFSGEPILRSVSMNSYMAGTDFGVSPSFNIRFPTGARNTNTPVFLKESEISRPSNIFVFIDEDGASINDSMFLVDMGGTAGLIDCMATRHGSPYPLSFADTHVELSEIRDPTTFSWNRSAKRNGSDYQYLTNIATAPLIK